MFLPLPVEYTLVRKVLEETECESGFAYRIREVHIVKNRDGRFFVRNYENTCTPEANGRPELYEKEEYCPVSKPDSINASNWLRHCLFCEQKTVLRQESSIRVDMQALEYARRMQPDDRNIRNRAETQP